MPNNKRVLSIDGLRGIACLSVVSSHFLIGTFGKTLNSTLYNSLHFLFDGRMAVAMFFIISGEALSISFIKNRDLASIIRPAIKRWPRLSIPVFSSAFLVFALSKMHLIYNQQASIIVNNQSWLGSFLQKSFDFTKVIEFSFLSVFQYNPKMSLNPFLWTMHFELIGSFFLFFLLFLIYRGNLLLFFISIIIAILSFDKQTNIFLMCFVFGFFMSYIRDRKFFQFMKKNKYSDYLPIFTITLLYIISITHNQFYNSISFVFFKASFLVISLLSSRKSCELLDGCVIQLLGKISFPLFLFQFPVLISFTSYLILTYYSAFPNVYSAVFISTLSILVSLILSIILYPIEIFTQKVCNIIYKKISLLYTLL